MQNISVLSQVTGPGTNAESGWIINSVGEYNEFNGYPFQSMHVNACRFVTRSNMITFGKIF